MWKYEDFAINEAQTIWTVQGVASAVGIHRNQAGETLAELNEYGVCVNGYKSSSDENLSLEVSL